MSTASSRVSIGRRVDRAGGSVLALAPESVLGLAFGAGTLAGLEAPGPRGAGRFLAAAARLTVSVVQCPEGRAARPSRPDARRRGGDGGVRLRRPPRFKLRRPVFCTKLVSSSSEVFAPSATLSISPVMLASLLEAPDLVGPRSSRPWAKKAIHSLSSIATAHVPASIGHCPVCTRKVSVCKATSRMYRRALAS